MKSNRINLELDQLTQDQRAFIYQQSEKFQQYLDQQGVLLVKISLIQPDSKTTKKRAHKYKISFTLVNGEQEIEVKSQVGDFISAVQDASYKLLGTLGEIHDQVISSQERENEVRAALDGHYLH